MMRSLRPSPGSSARPVGTTSRESASAWAPPRNPNRRQPKRRRKRPISPGCRSSGVTMNRLKVELATALPLREISALTTRAGSTPNLELLALGDEDFAVIKAELDGKLGETFRYDLFSDARRYRHRPPWRIALRGCRMRR